VFGTPYQSLTHSGCRRPMTCSGLTVSQPRPVFRPQFVTLGMVCQTSKSSTDLGRPAGGIKKPQCQDETARWLAEVPQQIAL
jgi:hypothetical protein